MIILHYLCYRCAYISFCAHFLHNLHLKKPVSLDKNISENVFPSNFCCSREGCLLTVKLNFFSRSVCLTDGQKVSLTLKKYWCLTELLNYSKFLLFWTSFINFRIMDTTLLKFKCGLGQCGLPKYSVSVNDIMVFMVLLYRTAEFPEFWIGLWRAPDRLYRELSV